MFTEKKKKNDIEKTKQNTDNNSLNITIKQLYYHWSITSKSYPIILAYLITWHILSNQIHRHISSALPSIITGLLEFLNLLWHNICNINSSIMPIFDFFSVESYSTVQLQISIHYWTSLQMRKNHGNNFHHFCTKTHTVGTHEIPRSWKHTYIILTLLNPTFIK